MKKIKKKYNMIINNLIELLKKQILYIIFITIYLIIIIRITFNYNKNIEYC